MKTIKKNTRIILIIIIWMIMLLLWGKFIYSAYFISPEEKQAIAVDTYNFEQLKKVKNVLKGIPEEEVNFINLKRFNSKFNQNIEPIKNCYYLTSMNNFDDYTGESTYIFGFQLESNKYKKKYGEEYYAYPKYDLPIRESCFPWGFIGVDTWSWSCMDMNKSSFNWTISNPCKD